MNEWQILFFGSILSCALTSCSLDSAAGTGADEASVLVAVPIKPNAVPTSPKTTLAIAMKSNPSLAVVAESLMADMADRGPVLEARTRPE